MSERILTASVNYTDLNEDTSILDIEDGIKSCRICLETEIECDEEFINPCKCKGGSKYVHSSCLNTWRASSTNPDAFYKCMECRYNYKFDNRINFTEQTENQHIHCNNCQMYMAKNPCLATILHYSMFLIFGYIVSFIDSDGYLYNLMKGPDDTKFEIYFFLGEILYILSYLFLFIYIFIGIENKRLYAQYCGLFNCRYFISIGFFVLGSFFFGYLAVTMVLAFYFQLFLGYHYVVIRKLSSIGSNSILNYSD